MNGRCPRSLRSQKQKKKEAKLPKQRIPASPTPAQTKHTQGQNSARHQPRCTCFRRVEIAQDSTLPKTNAILDGGRGVQKVVERAQKDAREKKKIKYVMWSRIAKAVDDTMGLEDPGSIQAGQVTHIINAILECALPVYAQPKPGAIEAIDKDMLMEKRDSSESRCKEAQSKSKPKPSWANIAARAPKLEKSKSTLTQPLKGSRADEKLIVQLREESLYRNKHLFIF